MEGVHRCVVGYSGGTEVDPTYMNIKDATECVLVEYDPEFISYERILDEWATMATPYYPQKAQYRSAIFYASESQKEAALRKINDVESKSGKDVYADVEPVNAFYRAEEYHQDFLNKQRTGAGSWVR